MIILRNIVPDFNFSVSSGLREGGSHFESPHSPKTVDRARCIVAGRQYKDCYARSIVVFVHAGTQLSIAINSV